MPEKREPFGVSFTKRFVSDGGEEHLFHEYKIMGHGHVELVDYMGGDCTVERVATAGHGRNIFPENPTREAFIRHLIARGIEEPFKSVQLKFSFQSPIDTALTFVYEPSASVNEYSGRYSVMLDTSHIPSPDDIRSNMKNDNTEPKARAIHDILTRARELALRNYLQLVHQNIDLARELARSGLGTDNDTRYFLKIDLVSLANLVRRERKRLNPINITHAYVEKVAEIASAVAPISWNALMNNETNSQSHLTLPRDEDVVDPPLNPSSWPPKQTRRVTVPALEEILFSPSAFLDHGEFQVVDYMGDDSAFAEAARTSYGRETKKISDDHNLIKSLIRDLHTSPIEMAELAVESKVPVFVDPRQAGRHRTLDKHGFMGYIPKGSLFYIQPKEEFRYQDRINRQGRGKAMDSEVQATAERLVKETFKNQLEAAQQLRNLSAPEELIRSMKGVGFYTRIWRSGDSHNWHHYLMLRLDPHAQKEIRDQAAQLEKAQMLHTPIANEAFREYVQGALRLSEKETRLISKLIAEGKLATSLDTSALDTYLGVGFIIPKRSAEGNAVKDEQGIEIKQLSREGLSFQNKLRRLLGQTS